MTEPKHTLKTTKRRPGRPKKGERVMTPEVMERIGAMWLRGRTHQDIADEVDIDRSTVTRCITERLKPLWRENIWHDLQQDMLKTEAIEQEAWKAFKGSSDLKDLDNVKWAIEHRAKIGGDYAAAKLEVRQEHIMRVAGQTPDQFDEDTVKLILEQMKQRSAYQAAVRGRGVN